MLVAGKVKKTSLPHPLIFVSKSMIILKFINGFQKYRLLVFISHMEMSQMVSHYIFHILKEGKWVICNDSKVILSQNPSIRLSYL